MTQTNATWRFRFRTDDDTARKLTLQTLSDAGEPLTEQGPDGWTTLPVPVHARRGLMLQVLLAGIEVTLFAMAFQAEYSFDGGDWTPCIPEEARRWTFVA
jgi:hypothetical protein